MGNDAADLEPLPAAAAGLDGPAGGGDDVLHDREAEPRPSGGARAVGPVEALEEARQVGLLDADAVVARAQDRLAVFAANRQRCVRARPGVAKRVLGEIARDDTQHPRSYLGGRVRVALDVQRHTRTGCLLLELGRDLVQDGQHGLGAERDDAGSRLQLGEEEHLVDQLSDLVDLAARLLDERRHVLAGEPGELEQREQARERRPQLVRDRGGEARAQLLVGGEIACLGDVDEAFPATVDVVRDDQRALALQQLRAQLAAFAHAEGLSRPTARGEHQAGVVEHDHRLTALLEQDLPPQRVRVHHPVTTPSPRETTFRLHDAHVAKVLIIEDDDVIAQGMARHLTAAGFDAVGVANGETGLARLRYEQPDVCVLDLMLPGIDGWRVIEQARGEGIGTPIVVVSARGTEHDRINALELGADDYLVKPFSMKELAARVSAAARRGTRAQEPRRGEEISVEELRLDPRNVQAYVDGESANLTPTEFRLIYALALDQGRVLTRDELLQRVWGRRASHRDRTVDVFVRKLREKIDTRSSAHTFIQTRYGVGYKLDPAPK